MTQDQSSRKALVDSLNNIMDAIGKATPVAKLAAFIVKNTVSVLGVESAGFYVIEENERARLLASTGEEKEIVGSSIRIGKNSIVARVVDTREPLDVSDYASWPDHLPHLKKYGFTAIAGAPLFVHDQVGAVLTARYKGVGQTFSDETLASLRLIARTAERGLQYEMRGSSALGLHILKLIDKIRSNLMGVRSRAEMLDRVVKTLGEELENAYVGVHFYSPTTQVLHIGVHQHGELSNLESYNEIRLDSEWLLDNRPGIVGHVARSGQPYRAAYVKDDPYYLPGDDQTESEMCAPLVDGDHLLGVIDIQYKEHVDFTAEDLDTLTLIADYIVNIKEGDNWVSSLIPQYLQQVLDGSELNLALVEWAEALQNTGGYDAVGIMLCGADGHFTGPRGFTQNYGNDFDRKSDRGLAGLALRTGKTQKVNNVGKEPSVYEPRHLSTMTEIDAPIREPFGEYTFGCITVQNDKPYTLWPSDVQRVEEMALQIAIPLWEKWHALYGTPSTHTLELKFTDTTLAAIVSLLKDKEDSREVSSEESQEIELLLSQLLRLDIKATVSLYQSGPYQTVWLLVQRERSKGEIEPALIKVGLLDTIREEVRRYHEFVEKVLIAHSTDLQAFAETTHYAGVVYSIDIANFEQITRFSTFYRNAPAEHIVAAIRNLFVSTCGKWHKIRIASEYKRIDSAYLQLFGFETAEAKERLEASIKDLCEERDTIKRDHANITFWLNGNPRHYPDPLHALFKESFNLPETHACARSHGQLTGHHILVDRNSLACWLVGFEQSGDGPALRDYVSLEAQVRWVWLSNATMTILHQFEQVLCKPSGLVEQFSTAGIPDNLIKPLLTIQAIRRYASEVDGANWREYQVGLLVHALGIIDLSGFTLTNKNMLSERRREHALLAAAMIADNIRSDGREFPDEIFERDGARYFVRTMDENRIELELPNLQLQMFELLFSRNSQQCTFGFLKETLKVSDNSRIHDIKSSLMKALNEIEDDLGNRCLRLNHGYGYRLIRLRKELPAK